MTDEEFLKTFRGPGLDDGLNSSMKNDEIRVNAMDFALQYASMIKNQGDHTNLCGLFDIASCIELYIKEGWIIIND